MVVIAAVQDDGCEGPEREDYSKEVLMGRSLL